ncbi:LytR/AlgR family response regulator transcription factor [Pontibacter sp. MBLB2868]|uniref:LytR/AlgR family response regulator transcription factor n=1 Tax=Pontibacter sp. MBLB2868 TaxID=3451555 RepID=UPI003F7568A1
MNSKLNYRCMIVDDESHAIELLSDYIQSMPQLQLVKTFQDPIAALMDSNTGESYDFIFLDVDMPRLTGIELAKALRAKTRFLVFTTAHLKYAVEAFDVQADHFLLKPIGLNKFALAIDQLLKRSESASLPPACPDSTFFIKSDNKNKLIRICFDDIIAVEGLKNYVKIYTSTQQHVAYLTMKETEDALCETNRFLRIHRSFIVAIKQIEAVNGRMIQLKNGLDVPVGDSYKKAFFDYVSGKSLVSSR